MRDLDEVLRRGFDAHVGEIDRTGGLGGALAGRTVRDVRRRRVVRASATGAVATAAAVGIVATAVGASGGGTAAPASQGASHLPMPSITGDPNSLGDCAAFIPANGALLPEGTYVGRAYVDAEAGFVVAVTPDGAVTRVQADADGEYIFDFGRGPETIFTGASYPIVMDETAFGGGGALWVDSAPAGWGWTVEPLAPAPAGVNVTSLYATFAGTFGLPGQGYDPNAIPAGATAEVVAHYTDGREDSGALVRDLGGPGPDDLNLEELDALTLRVTLADGQTWEIRADYDPATVPELPCQVTPPSRAGLPAPAEPEPLVYADPLSGPEAAVFQCEDALPANLEGAGEVRARRASGEIQLSEWDLFDVGDDGLIVEADSPLWNVPTQNLDLTTRAPGWSSSGSGSEAGQMVGQVYFIEAVALRDGVIVAAASEPVNDWTSGGAGGSTSMPLSVNEAALTQQSVFAFNGIHGLLEPCGATVGDLSQTTLAVIYGFGPDQDHVTFGWTYVADE